MNNKHEIEKEKSSAFLHHNRSPFTQME